MAEVFKLTKPIDIDGKQVSELTYDFESMTARDKLNASKKMKMDEMVPGVVQELDSDMHLYLFAEAVCKANPNIETPDVLRISAKDSTKAAALARSFFYFGSEE